MRGVAMDRREFLTIVGTGIAAAPLGAEAQQAGKVYRIGALWNTPSPRVEDTLRESLRELGWIEGQNFLFERRYSEGRNDRFPVLAAELVRLHPDLISAAGNPAALALKAATTTIPVVFAVVGDPVREGIVEGLARPGRNLTGTASAGPELAGKWLELFKEAIPSLSRVGVFINSAFAPHAEDRRLVEMTGRRLGLPLTYVELRTPEDVDDAFAAIARGNVRAVLVFGQAISWVLRARLAKLALDQRVAIMVPWREGVEEGALISYLESRAWHMRRKAYYIDRILKGAKPADLPVEQPTEFELTINLKTAKALGITIPPSLLLRADRVIE
jgi:putative ABC transport system substrate-binding protein